MKKTTILLMFLTIVSQVLGFGREITLSYFYGASNITDAYLISLLIPGLIIGILASGISSAYIPIYNKITVAFGQKKGDLFTSQVINILLIISFLLLVISTIFLEDIIKIFAYGFNDESLELTKKLATITLLSMFFVVLTPVLSGFLHNNKNYVVPALIGIPLNLLIIISIFFSSRKTNLDYLSYGFLAANAFSAILLFFYLYKNKFRYVISIGKNDKHIKEILLLALPVIFGASFNQINILIDRTIASGIAEGGISALHYANRINLSIDSIITMSFMVIFFPTMSKLIAENKKTDFSKNVKEYISWISLLIVPSSVLLMLFSTEIITLLFGRGAFESDDIVMTSGTLFFYSFGMVGLSITTILTKASYALQNTGLPMKILVLGIIINITASIILSRYIGINGLALGTSLASLIALFVLYQLMKKQYKFLFEDFSLLFLLSKIYIVALLAGIIGKQVLLIINIGNLFFSLLLSVLLSTIVYLVLIHLLKIFNITELLNSTLQYFSTKKDKS